MSIKPTFSWHGDGVGTARPKPKQTGFAWDESRMEVSSIGPPENERVRHQREKGFSVRLLDS